MTLPPVSLLTQTEDIDERIFCNETSLPARCFGKDVCHCVHRLKVKLNSTVELIIVDKSPALGLANHPFHLHGFAFFVVGLGQVLEKATSIESLKQIHLNENYGKTFPVKDTIAIPSKGYAILRFRADNPGFWLLHCHMGNTALILLIHRNRHSCSFSEFHVGNGMGLILQVGEHKEMVKPSAGFPKCNNFVPKIDANIFSALKNDKHVAADLKSNNFAPATKSNFFKSYLLYILVIFLISNQVY